MKKVWKYEVPLEDRFSISMPEGAEILCVQIQRDDPHIWAVVDPDAERMRRWFRLAGTDHPLGDNLNLNYIGSFQMAEETLIFHLFEIV